MMLQGILSIQAGDNPRVTLDRMMAFIPPRRAEQAEDWRREPRPSHRPWPRTPRRRRKQGPRPATVTVAAAHGGHGGGGHEEGHEGGTEWLISFADNVALMMGFFVILLAMNMAKKDRRRRRPRRATPASPPMRPRPCSTSPSPSARPSTIPSISTPAIRTTSSSASASARTPTASPRAPAPTSKRRDTQATPPSQYYREGGSVPFGEGESVLSTRARAIVAEAAIKIKGERWVIEVRGYSSPFETFDEYEPAAGLFLDRAMAVAKALVQEGLRSGAVALVAAGNQHVAADDRVSDGPDRHVEILVTNETQPDDLHRSSR